MWMILSGYQNNGKVQTGMIGWANHGWLLLEYWKGLKRHWTWQMRKFLPSSLGSQSFYFWCLLNDLTKIFVCLGIFHHVIFKNLESDIEKLYFSISRPTLRNIAIDQYHAYRREMKKESFFFPTNQAFLSSKNGS